jgi:predicted proteasome-type protease
VHLQYDLAMEAYKKAIKDKYPFLQYGETNAGIIISQSYTYKEPLAEALFITTVN